MKTIYALLLLLFAPAKGLACRYNEEKVRAMGRNNAGVRGIALRDGDRCVQEREQGEAAQLRRARRVLRGPEDIGGRHSRMIAGGARPFSC